MSSTKKTEEIMNTDPNVVTPSVTPEVVPATTPATGNGVLYTDGAGTPAGAGTPSGEVTPSTGSTEVTPPMTATQFAEWLRQQAVTNAETTRQQTIQASDIARRRSIADANSAYAKSSALYGQNAEKLASMGLQGGGYGEYLTSQAYQQNRSAVQGANAKHLAIEKEALYKEGQDKLAAESQYYSDMLGIQNDQTTAYNTLLSMANSGSTIESIMANHQWGLLSADQQAQIKNATNTNSFKIRIDAGESIDEIMKDEGFNLLPADSQNMLKTYAQEFADKKAKEDLEKGANFDSYVSDTVTALKNGGKTFEQVMQEALYQSGTKDGSISEEDIKELKSAAAYYELAKAIQNDTPYDDVLNNELYADLTTTAANDLKILADTKAQIDANKKITNMISGSSTWQEITASEYYNKLSDDDKETLKQEYDDELKGQYNDMITAARDGDSMDTIKGMPGYDRLSQAQIKDIEDAIDLYNKQANSVNNEFDDGDYNRVSEFISGGIYSNLNELRDSGELNGISDKYQKNHLEELVINKMVNNSYYGGANSETQFRGRLKQEGYNEEDSNRLVKAWQKNNLDKFKSSEETFSTSDIEDLISKGVLPEGSLVTLGLSSKKGIYEEYKNGDISADELIESAGDQNLGVNELPGFTVSDFHNGDNENFKVTVNGNSYKVFTNKKVSDSSTIGALNELATGDPNTSPSGMHTGGIDNMVVYNGQIYVYTANRRNLKQWQTVTNSMMNKKAYKNLLAALIAYQK